jgi:hypothetical protein
MLCFSKGFIMKKFILQFLLFFLLFIVSASSQEIVNETFDSTKENWTGNGVNWDNASLKINRGKTASKLYPAFESQFANQAVTITFQVKFDGGWESTKDYFEVYINNTLVKTYNHTDGTRNKTINATIKNNATLKVQFKVKTTKNARKAWIDNIVMNATAQSIGCDNSLDIDNGAGNEKIIPIMNHISVDTSTCISGSSSNDDLDYYKFTVDVPGKLTITTSSPNGNNYYLGVYSNKQPDIYSDATDKVHDVPEAILVANERIKLRLKETGTGTDHWQVTLHFVPEIIEEGPPKISAIPNRRTDVAVAYTLDLSAFAEETNNDPILSYNLEGELPDGLSFNNVTGVLSGTPSVTSTTSFNLSFTATDNDGKSEPQTFQLKIRVLAVNATNNQYTLSPGIDVVGNLISDNTGDGSDTGTSITVISNSYPSEGTLSVNSGGGFTYKPIANPTGTVTFTYTIQDSFNNTDTATVTIAILTKYLTGLQSFKLVNPPQTRNIVGSYKIAGNTVMCLTAKTSGYGGDCVEGLYKTSNDLVSKYIDIDSDNRTWNATSSYIELPSTYEKKSGKGIAWAGLFWQGRISDDKDYELQYAKENGNAYDLIQTGKDSSDTNISIKNVEANKIKLKIDAGNYHDVQASTLYDYASKGGVTYAAFANVTSILQDAKLDIGKHTFTVANLTTNEGREIRPGVFGGWSLVVIYLEDVLTGTPQNISIYNGFGAIDADHDAGKLTISGFRLPSGTSKINASLSVFSGEGEFLYGNGGSNYDSIEISKNYSSNYINVGRDSNISLSTQGNIFDAILEGILRDDIPGHSNNLQINNNGLDVDTFDVSKIITEYRNANPLIQNIYIKYDSNQDYVTPSMVAFSTELYQPNICYDYTLDIAGYVFNSANNNIAVSYGGNTEDPISTRISIQSQEGDFPLEDVNISYRVADTTQLQYVSDSTALAPNGISSYLPAGKDGLNQTYRQNNSGFGMYIGTGASENHGGAIGSFQTRYLKFDTEMMTSNIDTSFDLWIEYTVNYGSGPLNLVKNFNANSLCTGDGGYYPAYNIFNVASTLAEKNPESPNFGTPYNLYTQISNRAFDLQIFSYDSETYLIPEKVDTFIEIELFNAGHFNRDSNTSCFNPDSNISQPIFVEFDNEASISLPEMKYDGAISNTAFRVWYLTKPDQSFLEHPCLRRAHEGCFRDLYQAEYSLDNYCQEECSIRGSGCYSCLRRYYGKPICSRDNFSIRPEAFVTELIDSEQSEYINVESKTLGSSKSGSTVNNIVSGYKYRFDVNATSYLGDTAVQKYHQKFNSTANGPSASLNWIPNSTSNCNKTEDENISMELFDGNSISINTLDVIKIPKAKISLISDLGKYALNIQDQNWTSVDWSREYLNHHYNDTGTVRDGFDGEEDCTINKGVVQNEGVDTKNGCLISNTHTNPFTGDNYYPLLLQSYPYKFDLAFTSGGHFSANPNFVYMNTLNHSYIDKKISFNIVGTFRAQGYDAGTLSNFTSGCYAKDTSMQLDYNYISERPTNTPNLTYELSDYNTSNTDTIIRDRHTDSLGTAEEAGILTSKTINQSSAYYETSMKGAITMDLNINFDRNNDTGEALNPRLIHFDTLKVSLPSASPMYVNLENTHQVLGEMNISKNITFFYAKAKATHLFYDDVINNSVNTPVSIVIYCDLGFSLCQERGIETDKTETTEYDWWKSWYHNSSEGDGKLIIESSPSSAVNKTDIDILSKGENTSVVVSREGRTAPDIVKVKLLTDDALPSYTDRWLVPNESDPFYRVRFIDESSWAGYGETGHVVGGQSNIKKNRRLEW